jgi:hypothetical protein
MAGISQPQAVCHNPMLPCPILYDPAADDEVWVSAQGRSSDWKDLKAKTGDAAQVFIDPILPGLLVTGRYGGSIQLSLQVSKNGATVTPDNATAAVQIDPPNFGGGAQTPHLGGVSEIMTVLTESHFSFGDFMSFESPFDVNGSKCPSSGSSCNDVLVRNRGVAIGQSWDDVSPGQFGPGWIGALATSGGHAGTIAYVLTSNNPNASPAPGRGQVLRVAFASDGLIHAWSSASGTAPNSLVRVLVSTLNSASASGNGNGIFTLVKLSLLSPPSSR